MREILETLYYTSHTKLLANRDKKLLHAHTCTRATNCFFVLIFLQSAQLLQLFAALPQRLKLMHEIKHVATTHHDRPTVE